MACRTKGQLGDSVGTIGVSGEGAGRGKRSVQFYLCWGISVLGLARNGMIEEGRVPRIARARAWLSAWGVLRRRLGERKRARAKC